MKYLYVVKPDDPHQLCNRYCDNIREVSAAVAENRTYGVGSIIRAIRFLTGSNEVVAERHIPLRRPDYPFDLSPDTGVD